MSLFWPYRWAARGGSGVEGGALGSQGRVCGKAIGHGDGIRRIPAGADAGVSKQFRDDPGVTVGPSGVWIELARGFPMLRIGPASAVGVDGCSSGQVREQDVGEVETVGTFDVPIACERQYSRRPAAPAAVVPETGLQPLWQAGVDGGVPTLIREGEPGRILAHRAEKAEDPGVADRTVAPAVAVALDQIGPVRRIRVGD